MSVNIYKAASDTLSPIAGNGGGGETYTAGDGINISQENVISTEMVMFPGTKAEWEQLTVAEKIKYTHTCFDDDEQTGVVDSVPTENSMHLVTSGGVFSQNALKQNITDNTLQTTSKTVPGAINELLGKIDKGSALVQSDGVKTYREILNEIYAKMDLSKITPSSYFIRNSTSVMVPTNSVTYTSLVVINAPYLTTFVLNATSSTVVEWNGTTTTDYSTLVPQAGLYFGIVY